MAPESIASRKYSKKSDVWSFGIVGTFLNNVSLIHWIFLLFLNFFVIVNIQNVLNEISIFQVWEIVTQREPHTDIDIVDAAILIRFVCFEFLSVFY
jgi:serine/threonine protein kinase